MNEFATRLKIGRQSVDVSFRKVIIPGSVKYFVAAHHAGEPLPPVEIAWQHDHWIAIPPLPAWLEGYADVLIEQIGQREAGAAGNH